MSGSERVPPALQEKYNEIVALTDKCSQKHLTEEYSDLCRAMAAKLCRKRPSPISTGKANTWACGIVYALGCVNFLFDMSQTPHLRADELCRHFSLSTSTGAAKSKSIMDTLNIGVMDAHWITLKRTSERLYLTKSQFL
jgi:Domain of unknown function (DUF6398)